MNQKRLLVVGVLVLLLLINAVIFFTYRVRQQERIDELRARRDATEARLLDAKNARTEKERQLAGYREISDDVNRIYSETWSTPDVRLTALLVEMQRLAAKSQLIPRTINYTYSEASAKEDTESMTISFGVSGTYEQARRLISLIENSPQFVIIDQISLAQSDGDKLQLTLSLKTLFRDTNPTRKKGAAL